MQQVVHSGNSHLEMGIALRLALWTWKAETSLIVQTMNTIEASASKQEDSKLEVASERVYKGENYSLNWTFIYPAKPPLLKEKNPKSSLTPFLHTLHPIHD